MAGGKNNRRENNFFTRNIERFGDKFLEHINANDVQNASISIFRELAKGRVNIDKYGHYFTYNQLLDPCIESARIKLTLYSISYRGVSLLSMDPNSATTPEVVSVMDYHKKCFEAYTIILQQLNNIKIDKDVSHLYVMINALSRYKYNI